MPRYYRIDNESLTLHDGDGQEYRIGADDDGNMRIDADRIYEGMLRMPTRAFNVSCDLGGVTLSQPPQIEVREIKMDIELYNKINQAISDQRSRLFIMGFRPCKVVVDESVYAQMKATNFAHNIVTTHGLEIVVFPSPYPVVLTDSESEWAFKDKLDSFRREYFDNYWAY